MGKTKNDQSSQPLLPGIGATGAVDEPDTVDKPDTVDDKPLTLTITGEGKSKAAQFIDLIKRMGIDRAHRVCKEKGIYGVKGEEQFLVDTKCGKCKKYYRQVDGYYIFINTDTRAKIEQLKKLSAEV